MSYQVLARKYRPRSFETLVGQEHVVRALTHALEQQRLHHAYLFTGTRGVGKTTLSRILAKSLNCLGADGNGGITAQPCGVCEACVAIDAGRFVDYIELPALRLLAQGAHGSMRDALSLTDQAIAYAAGKVTLEAVQGMLGALDQSYLIRVLDALALDDGAALLAVADEMATRSLSYSAALQDLGTLLHRIALAQTVPAALPEDLPEREDVIRLAAAFDAEEIQLFYQIVVHGRNELGLAPD